MSRPRIIPFDLNIFKLHQVETPDWIAQSRKVEPPISAEAEATLQRQWPAVLAQTEATLKWAFTDPDAIEQLQPMHTYAEHVLGVYCIGRELIEQVGEERFIIEIEICLFGRPPDKEEYIYHRHVVITDWNTATASGVRILARETERWCQLAQLDMRRIGDVSIEDVLNEDEKPLSDSQRQMVEANWPQMVAAIQTCTIDAIEDPGFTGELDYDGFPNMMDMTGEYYIDSIRLNETSEDRRWCLWTLVRCLSRPIRREQVEFDHAQCDLEIWLDLEGNVQYYNYCTSVI